MPRRARGAPPDQPPDTEPAPPARAPLAPSWAFVVQLREGTPLTPERLSGRIEHILSGRATRFTSLAELVAFMAQVLTPRGTNPAAATSATTAAASASASLSKPRRSRRPSTSGGPQAP